MNKGGFRLEVFKALSSSSVTIRIPLLLLTYAPTWSLGNPGPQACRYCQQEIAPKPTWRNCYSLSTRFYFKPHFWLQAGICLKVGHWESMQMKAVPQQEKKLTMELCGHRSFSKYHRWCSLGCSPVTQVLSQGLYTDYSEWRVSQ